MIMTSTKYIGDIICESYSEPVDISNLKKINGTVVDA